MSPLASIGLSYVCVLIKFPIYLLLLVFFKYLHIYDEM